MKRSIMSKSAAATPSIAAIRPPSTATEGAGSAGLFMAEKPLAGSSRANRSRRSGRSSQSAKRFQRLAVIRPPAGGRGGG